MFRGALGIVVASLAFACVPSTPVSPRPSPPPPGQPTTFDSNGAEATVADGGPAPAPAAGELPEPPPDQRGTLTRRDDGTCWYSVALECAAGAACNPPPPTRVRCPPVGARGGQ